LPSTPRSCMLSKCSEQVDIRAQVSIFRRKEGIVPFVAVFGTMKMGRNDKPASAAVRGYIYSWRA
jgi:hypothetical protein